MISFYDYEKLIKRDSNSKHDRRTFMKVNCTHAFPMPRPPMCGGRCIGGSCVEAGGKRAASKKLFGVSSRVLNRVRNAGDHQAPNRREENVVCWLLVRLHTIRLGTISFGYDPVIHTQFDRYDLVWTHNPFRHTISLDTIPLYPIEEYTTITKNTPQIQLMKTSNGRCSREV